MLTVLGTTTVDIFVRGIAQLPERGDDEFSNQSLVWLENSVVPTLGGNGANAAYAAGALREQVRLWSAIGGDAFGELVKGWLARHNVDLSGLYLAPDAGTATSVILTDTGLRRNSFHHPGPLPGYGPHDEAAGSAGDWLLLTSLTLLPKWRGAPAGRLLVAARRDGVRTAFDLGPILGSPPTRDELAPLLPFVDVLIGNEFELGEVAASDQESAVAWAFAAGAGCVVLKQGAAGATVFASARDRGELVPAFRVKAVGTVGAGDSFDVGFIHAYSRGASAAQSARFGNAVAALVVSSPRGILDAPDREQVAAFLRRRSSGEADVP